jgi:roadblock/LC7 domain-containing protein
LLLLDGQVHHDTHVIPMGNYVIGVGNYVIVTSSNVGNYVSADRAVHEARLGGTFPLTAACLTVLM